MIAIWNFQDGGFHDVITDVVRPAAILDLVQIKVAQFDPLAEKPYPDQTLSSTDNPVHRYETSV